MQHSLEVLAARWTVSAIAIVTACFVALPACDDSGDGGANAEADVVADTGGADVDTADGSGSDTDSADASDDADGTADTDGSGDPTCEAYCELFDDACGDVEPAYDDVEDCVDFCAVRGKLPAGTAGDMTGNSIACRMSAAERSIGHDLPGVWCAKAGPTGWNTCGLLCGNYCHLALTNCAGTNQLYGSLEDCETACEDFEVALGPDAAHVREGDNLQCRFFHLGLAGTDETAAALHCPHGATDSAVCQ